MAAYRAVLKADPGNCEALTDLANQYILLGTAYTRERSQKSRLFQKAMQYCELAMYTNPAFRREADLGKKPWEAADSLLAEDAPAMFFWVTALQFEFKEVMTLPSKMINVGWMQYGIIFLDRIKKVAPDFGHGAVEFAYTICYCALPSRQGGDDLKCRQYMSDAVNQSSGYLLARWGRGKYFHQLKGDITSSRQDLQWVVEQDIAAAKDVYPWRVYFKEDAASQLSLLGD